jgi:hypothetical protein
MAAVPSGPSLDSTPHYTQIKKINYSCSIFLPSISVFVNQRPRGLSHELSPLARTLGSWVRIPLKAWMFMCAFILFVLFCV